MTPAECSKIMGAIALMFPSYKLTTEAIRAWADLFEDEDPGIFAQAMRHCAKEPGRAFFPSAGEVNGVIQAAKKAQQLPAAAAWVHVCRLLSGRDDKARDEFFAQHPIAKMAAQQVSFERIRFANTETELPWVRKEFLRCYEESLEKAEARELAPKILEGGNTPAHRLAQNVAKQIGRIA